MEPIERTDESSGPDPASPPGTADSVPVAQPSPPAEPPAHVADRDHDSEDVDEEFRSLLEGLRTSLPGVQVLFAFLLTAPLQAGFADFDRIERAAFSVAFYTSGVASILLIAPSVHQRVRAPRTGLVRHSKQHLIIATWLTIVGTVAMGAAIVSTTFLVSSLVHASTVAAAATAGLAAVMAFSWFYLPLVAFTRR